MTDPTPYPALNTVLRELVTGAQDILGDAFIAAYLQGSFALGDFDEHSDVDFMIVVAEEITPAQLPALQAMHAHIYDNLDTSWARHLEGSYFPRELLRREGRTGEPLWYIDNTSRQLERSKHDNELVVRWVTREHGITLAGPPPGELIDLVPANALRREVLATMRDWAQEFFADRERVNNRWYQSFVVISYCRMLQTLAEGRVTSKPAGVQWGLLRLEGRWAGLIRRAWAERPYPSEKIRQPADPADLEHTFEFVAYALALGDQFMRDL